MSRFRFGFTNHDDEPEPEGHVSDEVIEIVEWETVFGDYEETGEDEGYA